MSEQPASRGAPAAADSSAGLRRWYGRARLAGYACGLVGATLYAIGRRGGGSARLLSFGLGLLVGMFLFFVASYVLALALSLRRRLPR